MQVQQTRIKPFDDLRAGRLLISNLLKTNISMLQERLFILLKFFLITPRLPEPYMACPTQV
jgi:hypothetical protein